MSESMSAKTIAVIALIVSVIVGGSALSLSFQRSPVSREDNVIRVTGTGSVFARPDQAVILIGVEEEADTAEEAMNANAQRCPPSSRA